MSQKPILRDAETKDISNVIRLTEKLVEYEIKSADAKVIEDEPRRQVVTEMIARAIVEEDEHVWVVEKSGRILGIFIVRKEYNFTIDANNPICVFSHAYTQKPVISFYEIHNRVKEWAREKGCKAIRVIELEKNEKAHQLTESIGYERKARIYEMEV